MKNPKNLFKAGLKAGTHQLGFWNSLSGNMATELLAACGYDWLLIDTEHSPIEANEVVHALQAIAGFPEVSAVVRPAVNDTVLIKRMLDMGAQTLLLPYVESREEAEAAVRAMRYGPRGIRGVSGHTRATRYGKVENYLTTAEEELCLLVQVESVAAMDRLEEIATVDGVDGVFFGPSDLAASMGYPGQGVHPEVTARIEAGIATLQRLGVPAGILTLDPAFTRRCIELGTAFTAVGVDIVMLEREAAALAASFR